MSASAFTDDSLARQPLAALIERGLQPEVSGTDVVVDAATPWSWSARRHPEDWASLWPSLAFLGRRRSRGALERLQLTCPVDAGNFHELPGLIDLAARTGCDAIRLSLAPTMPGAPSNANLALAGSMLHLALLETLRDPRFARPSVELNELAPLRRRALGSTLPSDVLCGSGDPIAWLDLIEQAFGDGDIPTANALAAAARWRLPFDPKLRLLEGVVLQSSGQPALAPLRYRELLAIQPQHLPATVMLGTAQAEAGDTAAACTTLEAALALAPSSAAREEIRALLWSIRQPS